MTDTKDDIVYRTTTSHTTTMRVPAKTGGEVFEITVHTIQTTDHKDIETITVRLGSETLEIPSHLTESVMDFMRQSLDQ